MTSDESEACYLCDEPAGWRWHNGKWPSGRFCAEHIREKLDREDQMPEHKSPITTEDTVTTIGSGFDESIILPAGAQPMGSQFPTIRSKEAFDQYTSES